jgi:Metallo-peptidase family M12/FG-GAP-like repeat
MKKIPSFPQIFLLAAFFVLLSSLSALAQDLRSDLSRAFVKYDLVTLDNQTARRTIANGQTLSIKTAEKTFELSLTPRDLRAARYKAEDTGMMGARQIESGAVTTFKGKINGETDSEARIALDEQGIEGYFGSNGKRFFIESARKFSPFARAVDYVVYGEGDLLREDVKCDLAEKIESGKQIVRANAATSVPLRVIEIATEADFLYLSHFNNNPNSANTEILKVLNMVEGVYERELGLTFSVVYQHTWSTGDPFTGFDRPGLVSSFQNYWNANFPTTQIARDAAHLFSGKSFTIGGGYAYIGVICSNPGAAYGLSGYVDFVEGRYLITAHEIGHNLGANHSDAPQGCENTIMNAQLTGSTPLTFCAYTRSEISNFVSGGSCLSEQSKARFDFDGDARADLAIFRPPTGEWWYLRSSDGANRAFQFGNASDKLVPADYTGDGKTDVAIFRPSSGSWFVLRSEDSSFYSFPFGVASDVPAPADYDGDGQADAAVFRPSTATWFILRSSGGTTIQQFGARDDVPVAADYDGDARDDLAIFRPSLGEWWILRSNLGLIAFQFGNSSDKPVQGDYTGDGKTDVAIWRPSNGNWYILRSEDGSFYSFPFGASGDTPAPADFDGDGRFDATVFRPATATWFVMRTTAGTLIQNFGGASDKPISAAFIP